MNISYKSSQAKSDFKRAQHNRIPLEQVQENTTSLLNFIDTYEFLDTNAIEYIVKITELLKDGAKITALAHNNSSGYLIASTFIKMFLSPELAFFISRFFIKLLVMIFFC